MARTPVLPEATNVGAVCALLRPPLLVLRRTALDPLLPSTIGSVNDREARESGLWLKMWVVHKRTDSSLKAGG
jgi:hypothetical protein